MAGTTVNDSDQKLGLVVAVAGIRETSSGELVGLAQSLISGDFPPGEQISYSLTVNPDPAYTPDALEAFVILLGE